MAIGNKKETIDDLLDSVDIKDIWLEISLFNCTTRHRFNQHLIIAKLLRICTFDVF